MAPGLIDLSTGVESGYTPAVTPTKKGSVVFDPSRHLAYRAPEAIHSLKDLHLPPSPLSEVASTEPFPLMSEEAILAHRRELFSKDVLDNCSYHTRPGSVQLRGMAPRYAPFIHQFWTSPEVLAIVSDLAGVDLVPVMDYEICHTNVQLGPGGLEDVKNTPVVPPEAPSESDQEGNDRGGKTPVVPWHRDSHPFVCVVMLSDAKHMTGGETEIQRGDGTTTKVRSPQMASNILTGTPVLGTYAISRAAPSYFKVGMCLISQSRPTICQNVSPL